MLSRSKKGKDIAIACWRLDAASRSAVFASFDGGCPALIYFGLCLPERENLESLARMSLPPVAGGQLDPVVPLTLLPAAMDGWQGNPGIKWMGEAAPKLTATATSETSSRLAWCVQGAGDIDLSVFLCAQTGLLQICVTPQTADHGWLAAAVPIPAHLTRIIDHGGRWCGEFQKQETCFVMGRHVRESHEGRSGHGHFPGAYFAADSCDENTGECLAVAMTWSGGHRMVAERAPDGRQQVQFGFSDGATIASREIWVGYSDTGFNGASQAMQNHVRASLPKPASRPVHYNCWEAVYFRHSIDELKDIATRAAALGAERFVLDDGWFKGRNDDTTSLGDWTVDTAKFPEGLSPLVDHIIACGMEFGIWFEPEMVNTDSDLYRAHPDWVLGPQDQPSGRGQFVLDLSKSAVTDYLFDAMAAIIEAYPVSYIKWDHNRILTGGSAAQTLALYALLERLNAAYPDLHIESCASGGGRVDYGMLKHTTRVWLSDSNDALERLRMQHEASRWLPPHVQGSHVGPRQCHTSGRILPMALRALVAAQRHMGFEMDPRELTDEEAETLKQATAWYKANRDFMFSADHFRLDHPDAEVFAEAFVAPDKSRFVAFVGRAGTSPQIAELPVRLAGLTADHAYCVKPFELAATPGVLNQNSGIDRTQEITLSGRALMSAGLRIPSLFPASMLVYAGTKTG
ncbi:MAG: alpha-galactosidase [Ahrensia sp.]